MKSVRFLHTADWQLGKPFASVPDPAKRVLLQHERLRALERIARIAAENEAEFILVAGDLFDSPTPVKPVVSAAFHAIGAMRVPVIAIPGNHDFGGPGGPWDQEFIRQEMAALAPNFQILTSAEPLELGSAVIFPAPLFRRHNTLDPTAWIRPAVAAFENNPRPRIVLAHGSVHGFSSSGDEDSAAAPNQLDLEKLDPAALDFIALGDWHGVKQVGHKAWYAGTPEIDRFPKGEENRPGHILAVTATRSGQPVVEEIVTGGLMWQRLAWRFDGESTVAGLDAAFSGVLGNGSQGALLHLELGGHLTISESLALRKTLETWDARLIRLKLYDRTVETPSDEEIRLLTQRAEDPLIARVAARLLAESNAADPDQAAISRLALHELFLASQP